MAVLFASSRMELRDEVKNVHPFFGKRIRAHDDLSKVSPTTRETRHLSEDSAAVHRNRETRIRGVDGDVGKSSPDVPSKDPNSTKALNNNAITKCNAELLEVDPNQYRRKRQKSGSPEYGSIGNNGIGSEESGHDARSDTTATSPNTIDGHDVGIVIPQGLSHPPTFTLAANSFVPSNSARLGNMQTLYLPTEDDVGASDSSMKLSSFSGEHADIDSDSLATTLQGPSVPKSRKILHLNTKTGTIGSPPAKKSSKLLSNTSTKKRVEKGSTKYHSMLIAIRYGHDRIGRASIGRNIDNVLSGLKTFPFITIAYQQPVKVVSESGSSKSTHPFFLGKAAPSEHALDNSEQINPKITREGKALRPKSSMTLGEAKSHSPTKRPDPGSASAAFQHFGKTTKILKFPGAIDACWPPKGMLHIRASSDAALWSNKLVHAAAISTQKKSKYVAAETLAKDDILKVVATTLDIDSVIKGLNSTQMDGFTAPGRSLRMPLKHFENGCQIQRRVRHELSITLPRNQPVEHASDSEDELHCHSRKTAPINPALLKLYRSLPSSLTAFDQSQYETQSWIQKYSPCTAAEVLQCGREAFIVKEWLQSLMIIAVDSGNGDGTGSRATSVASRRSRVSSVETSGKQKRKASKLEGFVVSSEEENDYMDEISELEEGNNENYILTKRTLIRSGDAFNKASGEFKKLKNAVVISGPSGCGKTAMVYAIAKELGFEVFEINPNSKRGGKEILERVGDMTRNHLVRGSDHLSAPGAQNEDLLSVSDAISAEVKSGRQGTMNAFFKPKTTSKIPAKKAAAKVNKKKDAKDGESKSSKMPAKQQKQSLILLEEVDVLYEEDKQFWPTVINLIAQSKRPIIMTCNDERLLPFEALELHAIIRLSPPPSNIAIDYMLLVAAAEGHVIKRRAVKALYEARQCDLRAALTELDYWCQLGVGDRRGGFDWFYPRWPPGCDVDGDGHKVRVVSEGTYETGMGWMGRDFIIEHRDVSDVGEEVLLEAWDEWNIDIVDWHESLPIPFLLEQSAGRSSLSSLTSYEAFAESISVADLCACRSFATDNQVCIDTSAPVVKVKSQNDFIIGYELLQADPVVSYHRLDKELAICIKSRSRQLLQSGSQARSVALSEAQIVDIIAAVGCGRDKPISRQDFSIAFDPIAEPERSILPNNSSLEASVFDRTTTTIAVDVAPYVRAIVTYDAKLQQERTRLSNLFSEGGRTGKRLRTTRSALSALEGGARKTTRPEKYFQVPLNPHLVYRTGLQSWQDALSAEMNGTEVKGMPLIREGLEGSSPAMTDSS